MGMCPNMWGRVWCCVEFPALQVIHNHIALVFLWQFWAILHGCTLDVPHLKHITWLADVTSLNDTVMSYVMSPRHTCIGHVTFYYKWSHQIEGGTSCSVSSSGSTLSSVAHVWPVSNACKS